MNYLDIYGQVSPDRINIYLLSLQIELKSRCELLVEVIMQGASPCM